MEVVQIYLASATPPPGTPVAVVTALGIGAGLLSVPTVGAVTGAFLVGLMRRPSLLERRMWFMNQILDPMGRMVLRSGLLGRSTMLLTVRGRRTGKSNTLPTTPETGMRSSCCPPCRTGKRGGGT